MSETSKKKPAKKQPAKKQAQKKTAPVKGTGQRGRPRKKVEPVGDVVSSSLNEVAETIAEQVETVVDRIADEVVIRANDIKKTSLRNRMLKWFKR